MTVTPKKATKKPGRMRTLTLNNLRSKLSNFREMRSALNDLKDDVPKEQAALIPLMRELDPDNNGIVIDETAKGTAFVQAPGGSEHWDTEELVQWLRGKNFWTACSSRVFDVRKFEAEIASGNIPARDVAGFKKTGTPPTPHIRFGAAKPESK